jgi:hypothetical protein
VGGILEKILLTNREEVRLPRGCGGSQGQLLGIGDAASHTTAEHTHSTQKYTKTE